MISIPYFKQLIKSNMKFLGAFLYHLAISSICFCASCIFNSSKNSLIFGAGIPLYFFVVSLFIKLSDRLDFLNYFTLNTLYDTQKIMEGSGYAGGFIALLMVSVCLYTAGMVSEKRFAVIKIYLRVIIKTPYSNY